MLVSQHQYKTDRGILDGHQMLAGSRAERQGTGADMAQSCCTAALGPRRLAQSEQCMGVATWRRTLVGL